MDPIIVKKAGRFVQDDVSFAGGVCSLVSMKDPGKDGPNEDTIALVPVNKKSGLIVVADGAGGMQSGSCASLLAVETIIEAIVARDKDQEDLRSCILDGLEKANQQVMEKKPGAATTIEIMEINNGSIRSYHIGDSCTLVTGNKGKIKQQTVPQTPAGYAVESGMVEPDDALFHEERHIVSNLLGEADMKIEIGPISKLAALDTVFLASDGVWDNLFEDEVVTTIRKGPLVKVRKSLMKTINDRVENPSEDHPSKEDDTSFVLFRMSRNNR